MLCCNARYVILYYCRVDMTLTCDRLLESHDSRARSTVGRINFRKIKSGMFVSGYPDIYVTFCSDNSMTAPSDLSGALGQLPRLIDL